MKARTDQPPTLPSDTYHTTDLYLGAYLKACGLALLGRRLDGRRVTFIFEDHPRRERLILEFYGNGVVRVNDFIHALQDLKAAVYNL
jgi:hypothetical protein